MTKLNETMHLDEMTGQLIVKEQHNFHAVAEKAKALKSAGLDSHGESKLVGVIPMKMWSEWAKKHGVKVSDTEAMKEVVHKEMMNPDNSQFRVWEGRY